MQEVWKFVKTTILGGLLFLLPFAVLVVLIVKAGEIAIRTANPIGELLPYSKAVSIPIVYAAGVALIGLLCFGAGLLARTLNSGWAVSWLEDRILTRFPPYTVIRSVSRNMAGMEEDASLRPVLVHGKDGSEIGLLVEPVGDCQVSVFIPGSPNPSSGFVRVVSARNVVPLEASAAEVLDCLKKSGHGLNNILARLPDSGGGVSHC